MGQGRHTLRSVSDPVNLRVDDIVHACVAGVTARWRLQRTAASLLDSM